MTCKSKEVNEEPQLNEVNEEPQLNEKQNVRQIEQQLESVQQTESETREDIQEDTEKEIVSKPEIKVVEQDDSFAPEVPEVQELRAETPPETTPKKLSTTIEIAEEAVDVKREEPKVLDVKREEPKVLDVKREEPKVLDVKREEPKVLDVKREESKVVNLKREEPKVVANETNLVNGVYDQTSVNGIASDKKLSKNQKKKQRRKMRANRRQAEQQKQSKKDSQPKQEEDDKMDIDEDDEEQEEVEIDYVPEELNNKEKDEKAYMQFIRVFDRFRTGESKPHEEEVYVDPHRKLMERKKPVELDLKDDDERKDGEQKISKRKLKQLTRMSIADLKQRVNHPELVEMHDVTAKDPLLLLHLKVSSNNSNNVYK